MRTVVLVEDNRDNADLIIDLLGDRYSMLSYGDARSVLAALRQGDIPVPDLFLLDISLPGMDGTELLIELRRSPATAGIPAIALTAQAMKGDREELLAKGFNGYVSKPILDESALIAAIEEQLNLLP